MKEIRTTFYELRSYFVPGGVLLWTILEMLDLCGYEPTTHVISTLSSSFKAILFIIISYVIGHGLHIVANYTIDKLPFASYPPKDYFDERFAQDFSKETIDALFKSIVAMLGIQKAEAANVKEIVRNAYWVCFQYVMNRQNVETENFLGLTGFYRGITSAMMLTFVMYSVAFIRFHESQLGIISLFAFFMGGLFLTRVRRFNYYLVKTVYANFLNCYAEKSSNKVEVPEQA